MSQSHNPTDTQALLQSMLQRLKIQSGRVDQACLHTPGPISAASTSRDEESGASNLQKVNNSPVNGISTNGIASEEFGISAVGSNVGLNGEIQQPGLGWQAVRGLPSSPTQKGNIDVDKGEKRELGKATQPGITSTGTGKLFPATSLKDADITSFERTDRDRVGFGSARITQHTPSNKAAVTSMDQKDFKTKLYVWSMEPTNANIDTGSQEDKVLHMGNGSCEALAQTKDLQVVKTEKNKTNSSSRTKQQTSENKTRRWTQKIKERWRDRPGSFGKKRKEEERREEQKREQGTEISPQNQLLTRETFITTPKKEAERILPSQDSSDPSMRPAGDFDFSLGSLSLLEEITTGQKWAKFLFLNQSAAAANQIPSEELSIPPSPDDSQLSFTAASPLSDFSRAQILPDTSLPVSIDMSDGKQQHIHREADQSEPMEHGQNTSTQLADILRNSVMRSRIPLNRKRQHQSAETRDKRVLTEEIRDATNADGGESISPLSLTSSHVMEEIGESQPDGVMSICTLNSPPPTPSPSFFTPFTQAPKGVLKHSISHDSGSSVEIQTKRRRVEENRRVHFSEEVVTIIPPQLDLDGTEEEEEQEEEQEEEDEDSVTEESGVEQTVMQEVAPARRPVLPAWILALKRRNSLKKHRK